VALVKVFNLGCGNEHRFEGWFGSEADYQSQLERQLIECPMCGDHAIVKLPSAPRLNVSGARERASPPSAKAPGDAPASSGSAGVPAVKPSEKPSPESAIAQTQHASPEAAAMLEQLQATWMQTVKHVMENTEDVGSRFAEEARRIHYGETDDRAIRGQASPEEARSLREEGIDVMALPVPAALKGPVQ
jgi:hypothetical protein